MLIRLVVEKLALIEQICLDFGEGLNVLTGETGAGKSILVDAMEILIGGRASSEMVRTGADKAIVEGLFDCSQLPGVGERMRELGLQASEDCSLLMSREIMPGGRSACRINGRIVPLGMYRTLGEMLVDLHGQHEHQSLLKLDRHRALFDRFGGDGLAFQLLSVADLYERLCDLAEQRSAYRARQKETADRREYLSHAVAEIGQIRPVAGEDEALRLETGRLRHAERLAGLAKDAAAGLFEGDGRQLSAYDLLSRAVSDLTEMSRYDASVAGISASLEEVRYRLDDAVDALRRYQELLEFDPDRAQAAEERLHSLRSLVRKYGPSLVDVLAFMESARSELEDLEKLQHRSGDLEAEYRQTLCEYETAANTLSELRRRQAPAFISAVTRELQGLGMEKAGLDIRWERRSEPAGWGYDQLEFMFSANPGEPLRPLARIASGGEMSRVMLALKAVFAANDDIPTMVFDEIDAGIGGRTLQIVGDRLAALAKLKQVLCVTHSPHIAGRGDRHFHIEKVISGNLTQTTVRTLDYRSRVSELVRMLGSAENEQIARIHAEQILKQG